MKALTTLFLLFSITNAYCQYPKVSVDKGDTLITITSKQLGKINQQIAKSYMCEGLLSDCDIALTTCDSLKEAYSMLTKELTQQNADLEHLNQVLQEQRSNDKQIILNQSQLLLSRNKRIKTLKFIGGALLLSTLLSIAIK